jgi:2-oxoglutarate ferredoxin oxidoreductase subunit gamma
LSDIKQIRLCGLGGQGIILLGALLGQAGVLEGRYVSGSNSYGAQARGSGCNSEIVFSENPIDYPHLITADILVAMSQGTYTLYSKEMKDSSGLILYDNGLIQPVERLNVNQVGIPATEFAVKELKNKQVANIVILGALVESTNIVSKVSIQKAITLHVGKRFRTLNLKALRIGMALGRRKDG